MNGCIFFLLLSSSLLLEDYQLVNFPSATNNESGFYFYFYFYFSEYNSQSSKKQIISFDGGDMVESGVNLKTKHAALQVCVCSAKLQFAMRVVRKVIIFYSFFFLYKIM